MAPYVRTPKTASGARAVQIVWKQYKGSLDIEHVGSARDEQQLAALKGVARQIIAAGQGTLDLDYGLDGGFYPVTASKAVRLWDALVAAYAVLGFDVAVPDAVFAYLVFARIVEPTSKLDSIRVLHELGVAAPSYSTIQRRLVDCVTHDWRGAIETACLNHALKGSDLRFCLYDVSTLHWETHQGDGFRESGFSKQRRLEPQCVVGLLTTREGFPLKVSAFEGTEAETKTILPVLQAFARTHQVEGLTVVADAGMMSHSNVVALLGAGFHVIMGHRIDREPYVVKRWRQKHPGQSVKDGQVFSQPKNIGTKTEPKWCVIYYQYRVKRARRDLAGIDKTLAKAERQVAGEVPAHTNRFVRLDDGRLGVNGDLVADARARAGFRAYFTDRPYAGKLADNWVNLGGDGATKRRETNRLRRAAGEPIAAYHDLWHIEQAFRISKHDLAARPAYHFRRPQIEAHLTVVLAALAVSKWVETTSGVSIRRFLHTLKPIRQIELQVEGQVLQGETPLTPTARAIINSIHRAADPH